MRIPKHIDIFGCRFKVKFDRKLEGGDFSWKDETMTIGGRYGEEGKVLLHEIIEVILCELHFRFYGQEKSMPYTFHFDHDGLCPLHSELFRVLKENKIKFY